jgi:catalase
MSPVEKEHIVAAYTFELGKCYEQAIKERQLQCLAEIDPVLCSEVATGLGLPAPSPRTAPAEVTPSPALSQLGHSWPIDGRIVGIVAGEDSDLAAVRAAVLAAGMVPLVIAAHGGKLGGLDVQRTFDTVRSVELDAVLVAAAPPPAPSAVPARDAKSGAPGAAPVDPRVLLLIDEAWRHAKAIGAWGDGAALIEQTGAADTPGVVTAGDGPSAFAAVRELLANHRVWERFPASLS